jgi:hypothetical protein
MLLRIDDLIIEIRLRWMSSDRLGYRQARTDMLTGLRKKGHWRSAQDSKATMGFQSISADGNSCWESFDDEIVAGSEHEMTPAQRYEFVQRRTYGNNKPEPT